MREAVRRIWGKQSTQAASDRTGHDTCIDRASDAPTAAANGLVCRPPATTARAFRVDAAADTTRPCRQRLSGRFQAPHRTARHGAVHAPTTTSKLATAIAVTPQPPPEQPLTAVTRQHCPRRHTRSSTLLIHIRHFSNRPTRPFPLPSSPAPHTASSPQLPCPNPLLHRSLVVRHAARHEWCAARPPAPRQPERCERCEQ